MNERVDVAVVGAGVTGAILAHSFSTQGRSVVVIDAEEPGSGSTAASTALLLWEPDRPLIELERQMGWARAREACRSSMGALLGLARRVRRLPGAVPIRARRSVYIAADGEPEGLTSADLRVEDRLRRRAGLPSEHVSAEGLWSRLGVRRNGALVSDTAFDTDPLALTRWLLREARETGLCRVVRARARGVFEESDSVCVTLNDHRCVRAGVLVYATGYSVPPGLPRGAVRMFTTFAVASEPGAANEGAWPPGAVLSEAADRYLYARVDADGRVLAGGEDREAAQRPVSERELRARTDRIVEKLTAALPRLRVGPPASRWAGLFAQTPDGLPIIGPVPGSGRTYYALGYGGNGMTFAELASEVLARAFAGREEETDRLFRAERFG